jgi:hypothetical protein
METFRAILVNVAVPLSGLLVFFRLLHSMRVAKIDRPPVIPLFLIFATYGGWLMIGLTLLFWFWSGMALLGLIYLIFIAPIIMTILAVRLFLDRGVSRYHYGSFVASGVYPCLLVAIIGARFLYDVAN